MISDVLSHRANKFAAFCSSLFAGEISAVSLALEEKLFVERDNAP
jgi:hypothetical protein